MLHFFTQYIGDGDGGSFFCGEEMFKVNEPADGLGKMARENVGISVFFIPVEKSYFITVALLLSLNPGIPHMVYHCCLLP